jgi:hypothetical protein
MELKIKELIILIALLVAIILATGGSEWCLLERSISWMSTLFVSFLTFC